MSQAAVVEEFARRLAERMEQLRLGRGTEPGTDVGPLIDATQRDKVHELVDRRGRARRDRSDGRRAARAVPATSTRPTVLADVPASTPRCCAEEIFGPGRADRQLRHRGEAIAAANDTEYGLMAYVFTRDLGRGLRVIEALDTGMVGLNQGVVSNPAAPFGGVKHSGFGREGGAEGIEEYLSVKYVGIGV